MNKFQKILLMTAIMVNGSVMAGTMGPTCVKEGVTVPCQRSAWDLAGQGLYLSITNTNSTNTLANFTNSTNETKFFNPFTAWRWGFMLEGSYHFNQGTDVNLNWYHYSNLQSPTYAQDSNNGPDLVSISALHDTQWNAVNGEYGQLINFTNYSNLRLFGGGQYFQLNRNLTLGVPALTSSESLSTRYNGFGPRIGADLAHQWGHGFAFYVTGAAALLVGDAHFNTSTVGIQDDLGTSHATLFSMIPELEGKLGAKYLYPLSQGDLSVNLGYMWINYFNAFSYVTINRGLDGISDFGLNGPYVGMKWLGTL